MIDGRVVLGLVLLVVVVPGVLLRLILVGYPQGHPRKRELLAELRSVDPLKRSLWVLGHVETVLQEAPDARRAARTSRRMRARSTVLVSVLKFVDDVCLSLYWATSTRKQREKHAAAYMRAQRLEALTNGSVPALDVDWRERLPRVTWVDDRLVDMPDGTTRRALIARRVRRTR